MMRTRTKILLGLAAIPVLLVAGVSVWRWLGRPPRKPDPIPRGDYTYTVQYAEHRIRRLMKQHDFPSMAAALIDDQDVVWQAAFGLANVEEQVPATVDTVYKVWSVAKAFTALETMRLVEEGRVDLDAPVTDYLPGFSIQSRFPDAEPITIRHILTHHAGLPRNGCYRVEYTPGGRDVLQRLVASLADCRLAYPVGSRYKYSNIGPVTLGRVIEALRGESFASTMQADLLEPIGMESSAFEAAGLPAGKDVAPGYEYYKGTYYPMEQGDDVKLPSGNLYSTLEDMSDLARFVFRGGDAGGQQILRPETLRLMFQDQTSRPGDPQPMGLGWKTARVLGSELLAWDDGGPGDGTGALVALLPERKLGVVLIANEIGFEGPISVSLALELLERMLETRYGVVPPADERPEPVEVDRAVLDQYAGRYVAWGQVMEVFLHGDQLRGRIQGMTFDLVPVSETRFRVGHWLLRLGLADLLPLPIDLGALEIEFLVGEQAVEDAMVIQVWDVVYEMCPRYPEVTGVPALWEELTGEYELLYRQASGRVGSQVVGRTEIRVEDGVLAMAGWVGPLLPINETEIIILGGSFAGETMVYEPETGSISHQSIVYRPIQPAAAAAGP